MIDIQQRYEQNRKEREKEEGGMNVGLTFNPLALACPICFSKSKVCLPCRLIIEDSLRHLDL
jgi:hypothetical protein